MTATPESDGEVRRRKPSDSQPVSIERSAGGWTNQGDSQNSRTVRELLWNELVNEAKYELLKDFNERLDTVLDNLVGQVSQKEGVFREEAVKSWMADKKRYARDQPPEKVYEMRESVLTNLFQVNHIRTVYHLFIAILIIFISNTVIRDSLEQQTIFYFHHWDFFIFTLGGFKEITICWLGMKLSTIFLPFFGFLIWSSFRVNLQLSPFKVTIIDWISILVYVVYQVLFILLPLNYIFSHRIPPVGTFIVLLEKIRMTMKSHAFIRSAAGNFISSMKLNKPKEPAPSNDQQSDDTLSADTTQPLSQWEPNFSQYLYFLFAPTLVYRDSYPQTAYIRWKYVVSNMAQVVGCIIFCYYLFFRFCFTIFSDIGKTPEFTLQTYILASTACSLPGGLVMLLAFFAALHSWLNAFAEMLRFGDRLFYKDWWNASTFSTWYRTWNVVVHDWLYTYVFRDIILMKSPRARGFSTFTVFLLSATVHEYVLAVTLGFFYPVLFCFFFVFGYTFFGVKGSGRGWNVAIWIMLFVGWGQLMCLYSMEWYARINCQPVLESWLNYATPHSWFCTPKGR